MYYNKGTAERTALIIARDAAKLARDMTDCDFGSPASQQDDESLGVELINRALTYLEQAIRYADGCVAPEDIRDTGWLK